MHLQFLSDIDFCHFERVSSGPRDPYVAEDLSIPCVLDNPKMKWVPFCKTP